MKTHPNLSDADAFYEQLLDAHANLDQDASELLNARLILSHTLNDAPYSA